MLLCGFHHDVSVHKEGFQLVLSPDRTLTVRTKDDIPVPHRPALPTARPGLAGSPYRSQWCGDRFDLAYIVSVVVRP